MTLPDNLTYSQFLDLADRSPSLEGVWIYRLEHTSLSNGVVYPEFDIYTNEYLFLTLEDAERLMRESLVNREATYRFVITQLPVGRDIGEETGASWTYGPNGVLIDFRSTTTGGDTIRSRVLGLDEGFLMMLQTMHEIELFKNNMRKSSGLPPNIRRILF